MGSAVTASDIPAGLGDGRRFRIRVVHRRLDKQVRKALCARPGSRTPVYASVAVVLRFRSDGGAPRTEWHPTAELPSTVPPVGTESWYKHR